MANKIRIKRRATGGAAGAPTSLENAELAFNEQDDVLYYGEGTGGSGGTATAVIAIAGSGAFATLGTEQTLTGNKTFSGTVIVPTPSSNSHAATKAYVDSEIINATVSSEQVQDIVGAQIVTNGVHSGISAAYDDAGDGAVDLSLTNTAVTAASYGSSSSVATFTVDAQGRLTAASNSTISIASTAITDFTEAAQDAAASLLTDGTHSGIAATYDDANAKVNLNVADFTITLGGDLTGSVTVTDLANATLTATIATDSVALGTDTTGNYVGSVAAGTGLAESNTSVEGGTFTIGLANTAVAAGNYGAAGSVATFTVDAQGRLTAAANATVSITASQISDRATNLVTGITGTANEIAVSNSGVGAVTLSLPSDVTIANNLTVTGDLVVNGNTTTLNTATLTVEDKNIVLANVETPTDITADGAGISVLGTTTKTLNWVDATDSWTSSEHFNLLSGKEFKINGTTVLSGTNLDNVTVDGGTF